MTKLFSLDAAPVALRHLDALTGLRIYAALFVVLFHISLHRFFTDNDGIVATGQFILSNAGWFGVTFFFSLSGFVLTWSARSQDSPLAFVWRRVAKVAPNHFVTFFVALFVAGLGPSDPWEALANLLLAHAWVPRDTAFFSINHPSWSLSAEMFFYAVFPYVIGPVLRLDRRSLFSFAATLTVLLIAVPGLALLIPIGKTFGPDYIQSPLNGASILQVWLVYALPPVRLIEFILGMIAVAVYGA